MKKQISFDGRTQSVSAWAAELNYSTPALVARLRRLPLAEALTYKATEHTHIYNGKEYTLKALAKMAGCSTATLAQRISRHGVARAMTMPPSKTRQSSEEEVADLIDKMLRRPWTPEGLRGLV